MCACVFVSRYVHVCVWGGVQAVARKKAFDSLELELQL